MLIENLFFYDAWHRKEANLPKSDFLTQGYDYFGKIDGERRNQYNKKDNKANKYNIVVPDTDKGKGICKKDTSYMQKIQAESERD